MADFVANVAQHPLRVWFAARDRILVLISCSREISFLRTPPRELSISGVRWASAHRWSGWYICNKIGTRQKVSAGQQLRLLGVVQRYAEPFDFMPGVDPEAASQATFLGAWSMPHFDTCQPASIDNSARWASPRALAGSSDRATTIAATLGFEAQGTLEDVEEVLMDAVPPGVTIASPAASGSPTIW